MECVKQGRGKTGSINPVQFPSQILCLAEQILFTERCEEAIKKSRLTELLIELETGLDSYTNADIEVKRKTL